MPSNPAYPILWGKGDHALQTCLPPLVGGEGDHEVVEGGRRRRPYKTCGAAATATHCTRATVWPIQPPPSVSLRSPPTPGKGVGR